MESIEASFCRIGTDKSCMGTAGQEQAHGSTSLILWVVHTGPLSTPTHPLSRQLTCSTSGLT